MSLLDALAAAAASVSDVVDEEGSTEAQALAGSGHTRRTRPTHSKFQKAVMSSYYDFNKLPDANERAAIGEAVGLSKRAVQVWFQNRRQRQKPSASDEREGEVAAAHASNGDAGTDATCRESLLGNAQAARDDKARALADAISVGAAYGGSDEVRAAEHAAIGRLQSMADEDDVSEVSPKKRPRAPATVPPAPASPALKTSVAPMVASNRIDALTPPLPSTENSSSSSVATAALGESPSKSIASIVDVAPSAIVPPPSPVAGAAVAPSAAPLIGLPSKSSPVPSALPPSNPVGVGTVGGSTGFGALLSRLDGASGRLSSSLDARLPPSLDGHNRCTMLSHLGATATNELLYPTPRGDDRCSADGSYSTYTTADSLPPPPLDLGSYSTREYESGLQLLGRQVRLFLPLRSHTPSTPYLTTRNTIHSPYHPCWLIDRAQYPTNHAQLLNLFLTPSCFIPNLRSVRGSPLPPTPTTPLQPPITPPPSRPASGPSISSTSPAAAPQTARTLYSHPTPCASLPRDIRGVRRARPNLVRRCQCTPITMAAGAVAARSAGSQWPSTRVEDRRGWHRIRMV